MPRWVPLLLLMLGCDAPSEPVVTEFEFTSPAAGVVGAEPVVTVVGPGSVELTGRLPSSCMPYRAVGRLRDHGTLLDVTVTGEFVDGCPQDGLGQVPYRAQLTEIPAGTRWMRVVHRHAHEGTGGTVVLMQQVTVP